MHRLIDEWIQRFFGKTAGNETTWKAEVCVCVRACVCKYHSIMTLNNTEWYYVRHFHLNCNCLRLSSMLSSRPKMAGKQGTGENCTVRSFRTCTTHQIISKLSDQKKMRWEGEVARTGERKRACSVLVGKPEEQRPPGSTRHS